MAFKSYAAPGKFNPRQVQDQTQKMIDTANDNRQGLEDVQKQSQKNQASVISTVKEANSLEMASREKAFAQDTANKEQARKQVMRNYEIEMNNLKVEGAKEQENIKLLTGLSQTALKAVTTFTEEREKGMQEAYAMSVYETGVTTEEMVAIVRNDTAWTNESYRQNASLKGMVDRGVSLAQLNYLQKMGGGANRYMKSKALMQNTVAQAPFAFEELKSKEYEVNGKVQSYNDAVASGDPNVVKSLQSRISQDYIRSSGLSSMNPELVGTLAYPKLHRYWEKENTSLAAGYRKQAKEKATMQINRSFDTAYGSDGFTGAFQIVTDAPNRTEARKQFADWVTNNAKTGQFSQDELVNIDKLPVTIGNQTKTFKEWYGSSDEYAQILDAFDDGYTRQKSIENRTFQENQAQAKRAELEVLGVLRQKDNLTQQDIDNAKEQYLDRFPNATGAKFDNIKTFDEKTVAKQEAEAQEMARNGTLTLTELSKFDYRVFRKYQDVATRNSKAMSDTNSYTAQKNAIKELVKNQQGIKLGVGTDGGYTVPLKIADLTRKFLERNVELQQQYPDKNPIDIANEAVNQIRGEFLTQMKDADYSGHVSAQAEYPDMLNSSIDTEQEALKYAGRLNDVQRNMKVSGGAVLKNTGLIVNSSEAANITKNYGSPTWKPSPLVQYTADLLGISPTQVINSQLTALNENTGTNYPMLGEAPSIEAVQSNVPAKVRSILQKYPSAERSTRGLGSSQTFMPDTIPHGYGQFFVESSARHGVPAGDLAALAQIESSFNANAVSPTGAWGVMQIQGDLHPEYTGGADPQANIDYGAKYYSGLVQQFGDPAIAAGAYNAGPGRMQEHLETGRPLPAETVEHMKKFKIAQYRYGKKEVLQDPQVMRSSSPVAGALQPLKSYSSQVSSITMDVNQPGMDIFFEDHNFPSVLPGTVKDMGAQYNNDGSGYGNYLVIESQDPQTGEMVDVLYSHLPEAPSQYIGQNINAGELIGKQGGTGSVQSYDGTIASIDFLAPAPAGSGSMTPYSNFKQLRQTIASQLRS